jgi:hypothetical protein
MFMAFSGRMQKQAILNGHEVDMLLIPCLFHVFDPVIQLPSDGDYVKCSGFVKEVCSSEDPMIQKDSLSITQIEVLEPEQLTDCSTGFVFDTLEVEEIDKSLKVFGAWPLISTAFDISFIYWWM